MLWPSSVNQRFPSAPATMPYGSLPEGAANSVIEPAGVILPMPGRLASVNQILPSGPAVMPSGSALVVSPPNSVTICVLGLTLPILCSPASVNQRLPSAPLAMAPAENQSPM